MAQIEGRIIGDLYANNGHGPAFIRRWTAAARFYLETFERLAEPPFETNGGNEGITMPALHILRHALELHLIIGALYIDQRVWGAARQVDASPRVLSALPNTRNLQELAMALTSRWPDVLGAEVTELITQLHAQDPTGDAFLYPAARDFSALSTPDLDVAGEAALIEVGRLAAQAIRDIPTRVLAKLDATPAP